MAYDLGGVLVEGHDGLDELPFDPLVIDLQASKVLQGNTKCGESSIEIFIGLVFIHDKAIGLVGESYIFGGSDALIPNIQLGEVVPCSLGGSESTNMCQIFRLQCLLNDL